MKTVRQQVEMRTLIVVAFLALGASGLATNALAQESCSIFATYATAPGPFTEEETPAWITTIAGQSPSSGTMTTDVPHWPNITAYGNFPNAVRMTTLRGVWEKTGANTSAFTQIGWALDAMGDVVYSIRQSGRGTLTDGCNALTIEATIEFFVHTPAGDILVGVEWEPPMTAYRVTVSDPVPAP